MWLSSHTQNVIWIYDIFNQITVFTIYSSDHDNDNSHINEVLVGNCRIMLSSLKFHYYFNSFIFLLVIIYIQTI